MLAEHRQAAVQPDRCRPGAAGQPAQGQPSQEGLAADAPVFGEPGGAQAGRLRDQGHGAIEPASTGLGAPVRSSRPCCAARCCFTPHLLPRTQPASPTRSPRRPGPVPAVCRLQVARAAHRKHGGAEGLIEHQQARLDARLEGRMKVGWVPGCSQCAEKECMACCCESGSPANPPCPLLPAAAPRSGEAARAAEGAAAAAHQAAYRGGWSWGA